MVLVSDNDLVGASVFERKLFDALLAHARGEEEVIAAYEDFAEDAPSDSVRYLVKLILDDEHRHHRILAELANEVRAETSLEEHGDRVPYLDVHHDDAALLETTRRFLALERKDRVELKHLAHVVSEAGGGGELDAFLVDLMRADTERHIRILRFIERLVRRSPLR